MTRATLVALRHLALAQWREQPLRVVLTVIVIALGVALSAAVYLVNAGALGEFRQATRQLVGEADLLVRAGDAGFDERYYAELARLPQVRAASPVVELDVALPGQRDPLRLLGVDPLRAAAIQPQLYGDVASRLLELFEPDAVLLSAAAAEWLGLRTGQTFTVTRGSGLTSLRVLGVLPRDVLPGRAAIMDIASAQWRFDRIGRLQRIDLRLEPGSDGRALRERLAARLPPGAALVEPAVEQDRAANITRAYRVNLNMLALVSLLTGSFLVFSTQSLAVLRRRPALALLRALGLRRAELRRALFAEGAALGAFGALLGVVAGQFIAWAALEWLRGDLGAGQVFVSELRRDVDGIALLAFFVIGTTIASLGAWAPAWEAARRAPALALRAGDAEPALAPLRAIAPGLLLIGAGAGLALLPATSGIPLFGYSAIAAILLGAVLLIPRAAGALLARLPVPRGAVARLALARLRGSLGQSTVSLAAIVVSFSLMVAMAIMVFSFRESFEQWLSRTLPAPIQFRVVPGSDTAHADPALQARIAALDGVAAVQFQHSLQLVFDPARANVTLQARDPPPQGGSPTDGNSLGLPLQGTPLATQRGVRPAWVSEAMLDLYGLAPGRRVDLPLGGARHRFQVVGVFRDYGRAGGTIAIQRSDYVALTGDASATAGSVWLGPDADAAAVTAALRAVGPRADFLEVRGSDEVRQLSLRAFDRAFGITYALEAIAVVIGLLGIGFAASSNALARRAEFGMLRHVGLRRRDVLAMLGAEGLATSAVGVLYGLLVGFALSTILVYVVNRQSFNWSVDLAVPAGQLVLVSALLIAAAAATSTLAGRAALRGEAVRAVREDW